jgi:NAD(P)-dependent dehydrogenase (short-subunit alcohol dehydrogenase family)
MSRRVSDVHFCCRLIPIRQIKAAGGDAVPDYHSVVDGAKIVETAIKAYGKVDIVINNAGILRDVSFAKVSAITYNSRHLRSHCYSLQMLILVAGLCCIPR